MNEEMIFCLYKIALLYQQDNFIKQMKLMVGKDLVIGEKSSSFLIELIIGGNYDHKILHHMFSLPYDLMEQMKLDFVN